MNVGVARGDGVPEPAPEPLERWLEAAAGGNPATRLQQIAGRAALAQASRTAGSLSPSVDLVAQAGRDRISGNGDFGPSSSAATDALVGVQISIALYTGGADARPGRVTAPARALTHVPGHAARAPTGPGLLQA